LFRNSMTDPFLEHPSEEALERFLMNHSEEQELEVVETHILACESCVARLESLEVQVTAIKEALAQYESERIQKERQSATAGWRSWFTIPTLSWAGAAAAAIALGCVVIPHSIPRSFELSATRGGVVAVLPEHRPLALHLDAGDIPTGTVKVQLVNDAGREIWNGKTTVADEKASVRLPELSEAGIYFLRFYSISDGASSDPLREYRFEVR
jgi:hypothetical protein